MDPEKKFNGPIYLGSAFFIFAYKTTSQSDNINVVLHILFRHGPI